MTSDVSTNRHFGNVFTRKRKRSSISASRDSEFVLSGIRRDEMPKHRSCVMHMLNFKHGQCATRKQAHEIEDEYGTARCFFNVTRHGKRSRKSKPTRHGKRSRKSNGTRHDGGRVFSLVVADLLPSL